MKKFFILFCALMIGISSFAFKPGIDEKLLQSFKTSFPKAEEVNWYEASGLYVVNFKENGIRTKVVYQKTGKMLNMTRSYHEENLPYQVNLRVKQEYSDKKIFGVIEVTAISDTDDYSATEYFIKLEDEKNWYTVKMDSDGELSVIEKFKKSL